jgi:hypothetical protein
MLAARTGGLVTRECAGVRKAAEQPDSPVGLVAIRWHAVYCGTAAARAGKGRSTA